MTISRSLILGAALSGLAFSSHAAVEAPISPTPVSKNLIKEVGGSERINFSGKLRMLSQRIPAAACNLTASVDPDKTASQLSAAAAEFEKIVQALEHGDETLGVIGPETRRKTLAALSALKETWGGVRTVVDTISSNGASEALNQQLADQNMQLLGAAKLLVSEISGQYSDPAALIQSDAIRIDIAGRQRMLTQKMSKEACYILSGIDVANNRAAIRQTAQLFDVSLTALRFGMPEAGIKASDAPDIVQGLEEVAASWAFLKGKLDALEAGADWDLETRAKVFHAFNTAMANMNKVVGMYSDASKLGL